MIGPHLRHVLDDADRGTGVTHPTGVFHGVSIPPEHAGNWDSREAFAWAVEVLRQIRKTDRAMSAHKRTLRYEARQRLTDAVVVRRSLVQHASETRTVEDVIGRYGTMSVAQSVTNTLNDARGDEIHHL